MDPPAMPGGSDTIKATYEIGKRSVEYALEVMRGIRPAYGLAYGVGALLPPFTGATLRGRLYRLAGFEIGHGCAILGPLEVLSGIAGIERRLIIGNDVVISSHVTINTDDVVRLEDNVSIGPFVRIYTGTHAIGPGSRRMMLLPTSKPVTIERGAWIGIRALILPGVTVGRGSIVGAGSVVTADVPPNTYVEGNPAKVIRTLPWGDR
jgi:maltose O-acetyltransferase